MFNKKLIVLTIILACLLSVSAISAAENATDNVVSVEETTADVVKETSDEVVSVEKNQVILGNESNVGTFDELSSLIENTTEGATLELDKDYKYVSGSSDGIQINKAITIDGKGHILDGNHLSRICYVGSDNVMLKNIIFIGGKHSLMGGAIFYGGFGKIVNCTFINNQAKHKNSATSGGAIYFGVNEFDVENCTFKDNIAASGAAIFVNSYSDNGNLINCSFLNNVASDVSVYWQGKNGNMISCIFSNNSGDLGDVYWQGDGGKVHDCIFSNNFVKDYPGASAALVFVGDDGLISNCSFINNTINCQYIDSSGVAIYIEGDNVIVNNSIFINNRIIGKSVYKGSNAVYWYGDNGILFDSIFINNTALNYSSAVYWYANNGNIEMCTFINNTCNINDGVNFIKKYHTKLIFKGSSFNYSNPNVFSVLLTNITKGIPISPIIINFVSDTKNETFAVNLNKENVSYLKDELSILNVGTWNATAIFNDDNYNNCKQSIVFTVLPPSTSLTIDDVNTTVGHEVTLIANVNSTLIVNEGIVTFFDGSNQIGDANVVGGVATLTYTPSVAGEHTITAIFNSDNYLSSNDTALLTVSKADVELSIDYITDVYFTNPSNFAVNVNSNFKPVNEGKIKYYVNKELVGTVDVYEGNANFNYVTGTAGSFTLTTAYEETDNYFAKNASASFNVNKMPTTLSGESIIFDEEAYKTFTTELKDNNNNGVGDQPVKIEVIKYSGESATFNGISDANGITIYDVGRLAGGMWYVTGIYAGNNNYINSRFVDKFIVVRMNTTTEIEEIDNPKVNHNYKLKANIHDENGKLVKEGIVQFYLDGVDIGSIDLSKNQGHQDALSEGVLGAVNPMFEFVVGADDVSDLYINYVPTKAGKHTLTAVYEGTTIYKASNSTTSFDVSNSNTVETSIVASDVSTVYNGGKYIVIQLKDVNGKAVNGVKVTVVLGGKTYTPTTKNGQAKVSTNGLVPVKTYKATITFKGNSKYDKSTTTAKVVVKKATPKLTAKAKTFKKSVKTKKYTVTLKTNQNKVMKNTKLTLKVNKKTYAAKTNAKGQATFKITKLTKKGTFKATITYKSSAYYNKVTKNINIKCK